LPCGNTGPGYGGEDMFYLNLQTFVGFDF